MDAKLSVRLGANKDVTKDAKKYAIEVAKLCGNKGITKDAKMDAKWMLKGRKKRCNRRRFTKMYNSAWFSAGLFTTIRKKLH